MTQPFSFGNAPAPRAVAENVRTYKSADDEILELDRIPIGTPVILRKGEFLEMTDLCESAKDSLDEVLDVFDDFPPVRDKPYVLRSGTARAMIDKIGLAYYDLDKMHSKMIAAWEDIISRLPPNLTEPTA